MQSVTKLYEKLKEIHHVFFFLFVLVFHLPGFLLSEFNQNKKGRNYNLLIGIVNDLFHFCTMRDHQVHQKLQPCHFLGQQWERKRIIVKIHPLDFLSLALFRSGWKMPSDSYTFHQLP